MKKCRYDWFQSGDAVAVSVFAKCIDPSRTKVLANKDSVRLAPRCLTCFSPLPLLLLLLLSALPRLFRTLALTPPLPFSPPQVTVEIAYEMTSTFTLELHLAGVRPAAMFRFSMFGDGCPPCLAPHAYRVAHPGLVP